AALAEPLKTKPLRACRKTLSALPPAALARRGAVCVGATPALRVTLELGALAGRGAPLPGAAADATPAAGSNVASSIAAPTATRKRLLRASVNRNPLTAPQPLMGRPSVGF